MRQPCILLVEDSEDEVEFAKRAIDQSSHDIQFDVVNDGRLALRYLRETSEKRSHDKFPALVMLDLNLPDVDGFEILRFIRQDERLRNLPVVVFSSSADCDKVERCYRLGANSYVIKPGRYERFLEAVTSVVDYWLTWNKRSS